LIYVTLILVFAFFYVASSSIDGTRDNMRKNAGSFPHPAGAHFRACQQILKRLTFIGAVYLALVCLLPEWMIAGIHLDHLGWGSGRGLTGTFRSGFKACRSIFILVERRS